MIGGYRKGGSPMHRLPAWSKVLLLALWGVATVIFSDPVIAVGLMVAALSLLVSVVPEPKPTARGLAYTLVIAALAAAYQVWKGQYDLAVDLAADLIGLVSLSMAITVSTPMGEMLDLAAAAARPFRRVLPPAIPGLMFAIMLRAIPQVSMILGQSREAAKARGVERSVRALMIPTATRTVGFALDLGSALHARGIGDDAAADAPTRRRRADAGTKLGTKEDA